MHYDVFTQTIVFFIIDLDKQTNLLFSLPGSAVIVDDVVTCNSIIADGDSAVCIFFCVCV